MPKYWRVGGKTKPQIEAVRAGLETLKSYPRQPVKRLNYEWGLNPKWNPPNGPRSSEETAGLEIRNCSTGTLPEVRAVTFSPQVAACHRQFTTTSNRKHHFDEGRG